MEEACTWWMDGWLAMGNLVVVSLSTKPSGSRGASVLFQDVVELPSDQV